MSCIIMITERAKTVSNCAGVTFHNRRVFVSLCTVLARALCAVTLAVLFLKLS